MLFHENIYVIVYTPVVNLTSLYLMDQLSHCYIFNQYTASEHCIYHHADVKSEDLTILYYVWCRFTCITSTSIHQVFQVIYILGAFISLFKSLCVILKDHLHGQSWVHWTLVMPRILEVGWSWITYMMPIPNDWSFEIVPVYTQPTCYTNGLKETTWASYESLDTWALHGYHLT